MANALHVPLPTFAFTRLLTLSPGALWSPLHASLKTFALLACPEYEALSYTWGSPGNEREITVNGVSVKIRKNLWQALQRVRLKREPRVIWVDALSISQTDLDEKAAQVSRIGEIFRTARRVLVWTGEHADESEKLFRSRETPRHLAWAMYKRWRGAGFKPNRDQNEHYWLIWRTFLNRPYFWRTWVVQEVAVAKSIVIHCGDDTCNWETLIESRLQYGDSTASLEYRKALDTENEVNSDAHIWHVANLQQFRNASQTGMTVDNDRNFPTLLGLVRHTKCEDRRNNVYALLSLAPDVAILQPDYTIPVVELFLKVCRSFLQVRALYLEQDRSRLWIKNTMQSLHLTLEEVLVLLKALTSFVPTRGGFWSTEGRRHHLLHVCLHKAAEHMNQQVREDMEHIPFTDLKHEARRIVHEALIHDQSYDLLRRLDWTEAHGGYASYHRPVNDPKALGATSTKEQSSIDREVSGIVREILTPDYQELHHSRSS